MTHSQPGVRPLSRWVKSLVCFGTLVTCFIVCLCSDGASGWEQTTGPPGGRVNCVAVDIHEPAIVYAGLGELGIYRSTDGGTTWEPSKAQMGGWIGNITSTPHGVFASCGNFGLFRTTDQGLSWDLVEVAPETRITGMHYSPFGDIFLATSEGGLLYASRNGGSNWFDIGGNLPSALISAMAASGPIEYWVAKGGRGELGVYHTTNGGKSWEQSTLPQIRDAGVGHIFVAHDDPSLILVGFHNIHNEGRPDGVSYSWLSRNGGESWLPVWGFFDPDNGWLPLAQGLDGALYVNNANHLYASHDRARTWQRLRLSEGLEGRRPGDIGNMVVHPADPDVLFVPVLNGVAVSRDGGQTWRVENAGMILTQVSLLAVDPIDPAVVYAASAGGEGTFRSKDRGNTWTWLNSGGLPHPWADELLVHPTDPSTIYEIVDTSEVYRSEDHGATWSIVWPEFRFSSIYALSAAPSDPSVLYACKNGFGLYKSEDGGDRWRFLHHSGVDYTYTIAVHPNDPDIVYSGYSPKPFQDWAMVRRSIDGGTAWETVLEVPHSRGITSVAIDPSDPETIYAGNTGPDCGIWVSHDGGNSWGDLNEDFLFSTIHSQNQLALDPTDEDTVYAAPWGAGLFKTVDGGATWMDVDSLPTLSIASLAIHPGDPEILYAAGRAHPILYRSEDGGRSWEEMFNAGPEYARLFKVKLDPSDPDTVYVAAFRHNAVLGSLFRIRDGEATEITGSIPRAIIEIEIDPSNSQTLYVSLHGEDVYKSIDAGANWDKLDAMPVTGVFDIAIDPSNPDILYAAVMAGRRCPPELLDPRLFSPVASEDIGSHGVYKSIDGGQSWENVNRGILRSPFRALAIHPGDPAVIYAAGASGFYLSTDGGDSWTKQTSRLDYSSIGALVVSVNRVYAGSRGGGVYVGKIDPVDYSVHWSATDGPKPRVYNIQIVVDPTDSDVIYASSYPGGLFKTTDGGATWKDKNFFLPSFEVDDPNRQGYYRFAIDPTDPNRLYFAVYGKGVYVSNDGANTQMPLFGENNEMRGKLLTDIAINPLNPDEIYAATEDGVYRTADGGTSWSDFSGGLRCPDIRTLTVTTDETLYAGSKGYGLYRRGVSAGVWEQTPAFREFGAFWPIWDNRPLYQYTSLLIDPTDPKTMYFGTFPAGVYKTVDGGEHWRESNVGWTNDGVFCLVFHPDNSETIYAGTYNGINRSLDGGQHWEIWDEGWPPEQWVFSIAFDSVNPSIMYACSKNGEDMGRGRPDFHGTVMKSTDGGAHWSPITQGLNVSQEFLKILVDPQDRNTLYLATQNQGVCISDDAGKNWRPWNDGLRCHAAGTNGNNVANVLALSANGRTLYFATLGAGVWRRTMER